MKPMFTVVILSKCVNSNITLGLFLWLDPARLASGSIMFLGRAFVHSSVTKPQTQYSENEWTDFSANWNKWLTGQGHEVIQFEGLEVPRSRYMRPK